MTQSVRDAVMWSAFAAALVLATAPVWRMWLVGFDPTLDQLMQLAICGGKLN